MKTLPPHILHLSISQGSWLMHQKLTVTWVKHKCQLLRWVWLFVTPRTVDHQAPLSMGFSRQKYWSWVAISFSRGSAQPRDWTCVSFLDRFFTIWATRDIPSPKYIISCVEYCCCQMKSPKEQRRLHASQITRRAWGEWYGNLLASRSFQTYQSDISSHSSSHHFELNELAVERAQEIYTKEGSLQHGRKHEEWETNILPYMFKQYFGFSVSMTSYFSKRCLSPNPHSL